VRKKEWRPNKEGAFFFPRDVSCTRHRSRFAAQSNSLCIVVVGERSCLITPTKLQGIGSFVAKLPHATVIRELIGVAIDTGSAFFVKLVKKVESTRLATGTAGSARGCAHLLTEGRTHNEQ